MDIIECISCDIVDDEEPLLFLSDCVHLRCQKDKIQEISVSLSMFLKTHSLGNISTSENKQ